MSNEKPAYAAVVEANRRAQREVAASLGLKLKSDTISTTCARCSATIDPAAVEQHHERCFVAGDAVRWEFPSRSLWAEGSWVGSADHGFWTEHRIGITAASGGWESSDDDDDDTRPPVVGTIRHFGVDNVSGTAIRHIQRPGQAELKTSADQINERIKRLNEMRMEHLASKMPKRDDELQDAYEAMEEFTPILPPGVDPLDVKYGGVTLRHLLTISEACRREGHPNYRTAWRRLSDEQRAAVSSHWSAGLRARISAAKERERLSVTYCEVDVDD